MSRSLKGVSYNTELNCHIANVCSGYTQVPGLTVRLLIDSADFWQTSARFQDDRTARSHFARAEAFKAAARSLAYKLTDCDCGDKSGDSDSELVFHVKHRGEEKMVAVKITAPTCLHTDHDESCLSCLIEDENPDEIEITVRGEFKFTYIYRLPSGMPDGSPEVTYWKFDGVRWVSKS